MKYGDPVKCQFLHLNFKQYTDYVINNYIFVIYLFDVSLILLLTVQFVTKLLRFNNRKLFKVTLVVLRKFCPTWPHDL